MDIIKRYAYSSDLSLSLSVFVSFLSEKPFYPLKPTSVYGEAKVPATSMLMAM